MKAFVKWKGSQKGFCVKGKVVIEAFEKGTCAQRETFVQGLLKKGEIIRKPCTKGNGAQREKHF